MVNKSIIGAVCISATVVALNVNAVTFSAGNLLVQSQTAGSLSYDIREFDLSGTQIQSFNVPKPAGQSDQHHPRDLSFDKNGQLQVYNGTFDPRLSTFNPSAESWSHTVSASGWSTVNNGSYGGLATFGDSVFLTDMNTAGGGSASGIIAHNTSTHVSTRFGTGSNPIDLNIGLDGLLYVLEGLQVKIYDPESFQLFNSVSLFGAGDIRSIAADQSGNIYAATWGSSLFKYDSTGQMLNSIATTGSAIDLDVNLDGVLALGTRLDGVFITDTDFSSSSSFDTGRWNSFVTFTVVPVPAAVWLFASGLLGLFGIAIRKV